MFPKRKNIIRAGKYTHSDAFMSTARFLGWSGLGKNRWPASFTAPNAVLCGKFCGPLNEKLKTYPFAAYSSRFPGVSINVADAALSMNLDGGSAATATPEVYMSGKFIIPGIKDGAALSTSLAVLADVYRWVTK